MNELNATKNESIHDITVSFLKKYLCTKDFNWFDASNFDIEYFTKGGGTYIYLLVTNGKKYAIRVNFFHGKNEWGVKQAEFNILQKLTVKSYAYSPHVYHFSSYSDKDNELKQDLVIVDFVEGEDFSKSVLDNSDIEKLAIGLFALHSLESLKQDVIYECGIFDEFAGGEDKRIENYKETDFPGISHVYINYNIMKQELGSWFVSLNCFNYCFDLVLCHGDLKKENVIKTKEGICFIDWECSEYDIFETDIARIFSGFSFSESEKQVFIKMYNYQISGKENGTENNLVINQDALIRINSICLVLDFFKILDEFCCRKTKKWSSDDFRDEYNNWYQNLKKYQ